MRRFVLTLVAAAGLAGLAASTAQAAHDVPYYKLNYAHYDYTYDWEQRQADRYASFYWEGKPYCRYRSGWQGPGSYEAGTRTKTGHGWDGGYAWQGPGVAVDHDDEASFAEYQATYRQNFGRLSVCSPRRAYRRHHHPIVLRRKD